MEKAIPIGWPCLIRKMSFHLPRVFPDRSLWHNGKHPIYPSIHVSQSKNVIGSVFVIKNADRYKICIGFLKRTQSRYFELFWRHRKLPFN